MRKQQQSGIGPLDPLTKASLVVAALMIVGGIAWWIAARTREIDHEPGGYMRPSEVLWSWRAQADDALRRRPVDVIELQRVLEDVQSAESVWLDTTIEPDVRTFRTEIEARLAELRRK